MLQQVFLYHSSETTQVINYLGEWIEPRAGLEVMKKIKIC
jgi:hypothetical protein